MRTFATFKEACARFDEEFRIRSRQVRSERWQGVATKPEHTMQELLFESFTVPLRTIEDLDHWRQDIGPNLPFSDVHFAERVSGDPSNPGEAWKIWPWGNSADTHRTEDGKFTHTYQERFWPKYAGEYYQNYHKEDLVPERTIPHEGLRYEYGDLNDLVTHLEREPLSRQAYLPIWFPEDLTCPGRKPCSLGYHFLMRGDYLHITYYIRSCDYVRHFRDDCYLTVRLALWVLDSLRKRDPRWNPVRIGLFNMHLGSFHMFINDYLKKYNARPPVA